MFDKFDTWQFRDDANCWDFVCAFYLDKLNIKLPRFGIHPDSKSEMTNASLEVGVDFVGCEPQDYAIACHYIRDTLYHVGVVFGGKIKHTSSQFGTLTESIESFERRAPITKYEIHKSLWQS